VLYTSTKIRTKLKGRWTFHGRLFGALQSTFFGWKSTSACQGYCHSIDGSTLFFNVVLNKLRYYVKNEITSICVKHGVDLINTSKVTSLKTRWPRFCVTLYRWTKITNERSSLAKTTQRRIRADVLNSWHSSERITCQAGCLDADLVKLVKSYVLMTLKYTASVRRRQSISYRCGLYCRRCQLDVIKSTAA